MQSRSARHPSPKPLRRRAERGALRAINDLSMVALLLRTSSTSLPNPFGPRQASSSASHLHCLRRCPLQPQVRPIEPLPYVDLAKNSTGEPDVAVGAQ